MANTNSDTRMVTCTPTQALAEIKALDKILAQLGTRLENAQKYTRYNTTRNLERAINCARIARQMYMKRADDLTPAKT